MDVSELLRVSWRIVIEHGFTLAWRVLLLGTIGAALGLLLLLLCYKFVYRGHLLKLDWKHEQFFEKGTLCLWILAIPCTTVCLGALLGTWWAGLQVIKTENLGERIGQTAFRAVAAGVASVNLKESEYEQAKLAKALLSGEQKLTIAQISQFSSRRVGELSAAQLENLFPAQFQGKFRDHTIWAVESSLDMLAYSGLNGGGDLMYKLTKEITEHDQANGQSGLVTIEEISNIAGKIFLNKGCNSLWLALMLQLILPVLAVLVVLPIGPPLLAWLTRKFLAWRIRRAHSRDEQ